MHLYIIDTSVFNKLYLNEEGREKAILLFEKAAQGQFTLVAPFLLYYEVVATAQYYRLPIQMVVELLESQIKHNLTLIEPDQNHRKKAIEMIQIGHPKSGYPSIYDSIFYAIAIVEGGILISADRKHFMKTRQMGHVLLLSEVS